VPRTAPTSPMTADRAGSASDRPLALPRARGAERRLSVPDRDRIARKEAVPGYPIILLAVDMLADPARFELTTSAFGE
jgi:hypothetical protein